MALDKRTDGWKDRWTDRQTDMDITISLRLWRVGGGGGKTLVKRKTLSTDILKQRADDMYCFTSL